MRKMVGPVGLDGDFFHRKKNGNIETNSRV